MYIKKNLDVRNIRGEVKTSRKTRDGEEKHVLLSVVH